MWNMLKTALTVAQLTVEVGLLLPSVLARFFPVVLLLGALASVTRADEAMANRFLDKQVAVGHMEPDEARAIKKANKNNPAPGVVLPGIPVVVWVDDKGAHNRPAYVDRKGRPLTLEQAGNEKQRAVAAARSAYRAGMHLIPH
jgi:hypothetical protein